MSAELIPDEGTPEYFDFLLKAVVEEAIIYGRLGSGMSTGAIDFHMGMLRAAYQRAGERQETVTSEQASDEQLDEHGNWRAGMWGDADE